MTAGAAVGFWPTVRLLLRTARRRSTARQRRQRELLSDRKGGNALSGLALVGALLVAALAHGVFWSTLDTVLLIGTYYDAERDGALLVDRDFPNWVRDTTDKREQGIGWEASRHQRAFGGERAEYERRVRRHLDEHGTSGLVFRGRGDGLATIARTPRLGLIAGMAVVWLWFLMMAFQGEGLELDVQRQRHPMWEWLFSHPIPPGAAFFAEMLGPLAANPIFAAAPIFWCLSLHAIHGVPGIPAGIVIGAAMGVAASCFSKAIEIAAIVRLPPRSRGAVIGILSWVGYSALVIGFFSIAQRGILVALVSAVDHAVPLVAAVPARWMFGVTASGDTSLPLAVVTCLALSAVVIASSVRLAVRASDAGIARGADAPRYGRRAARDARRPHLVRDPLLRKEFLWFARDRSAVVQGVLIPLTMGAAQAFNLRSLASQAGNAWNWLCGLGVLCGTYMLTVVGPRSLTSEGAALWIALTWPHGLEPLLKAKARLWWILSSIVVLTVLGLAIVRFPGDAARIALVAAGWLIFGRSLAEKTVTLVVAPSSSGEPEPVPRGRRMAATLGTFSFGAGVIMRNWHLAALGVIFSTLTSAAMWQNFRERLPCLFDPSSERMPPPPTLMHAMVAITAMVDGMALVGIVFLLVLGSSGVALAQTAAYGVTGLVTWIVMTRFLADRGVPASSVWEWPVAAQSRGPALVDWVRRIGARPVQLVFAAGVGIGLGALGLLYQDFIQIAPLARTLEHPQDRLWLFLAAVACAPLAEEYLFRGLLFRALDREWGGWRALLGSAVFFAVYHPPIAWIPVGLVGVVLAVLFKASGSLWPGVIVHAVYNAIITLSS